MGLRFEGSGVSCCFLSVPGVLSRLVCFCSLKVRPSQSDQALIADCVLGDTVCDVQCSMQSHVVTTEACTVGDEAHHNKFGSSRFVMNA